jgi:Peptidase_C39 like family
LGCFHTIMLPTPVSLKKPRSLSSTPVSGNKVKPSRAKQALLVLGLLATLVGAVSGGGFLFGWPLASAASPAPTAPPKIPVTALVQDVPQYLPAGYDSLAQFEQWSGYTCGPATITAILHAYGAKTRIGIIFDLLYYPQFGIMDIDQQGLHGPDGFVPLLKKYYASWHAFPFDGKSSGYLSYAHLQRIVEAGYPVAADFWNDGSFWPNLSEGHWMTIVGFTATHVIVRDSSTFHLDNQLSIALFKKIYTGIAAPILPVGVQLP